MHDSVLERRFLESMGGAPQIDDATADILIRIKADLYPSESPSPLSYKDVMSLAIACAPRTEWDLWDTITYANPTLVPQANAMLDGIVNGVYNYYKDYRAPTLVFSVPNEGERACLQDLISRVSAITDNNLDAITSEVYECGKVHFWSTDLRAAIDAVPPLNTDGMTPDEGAAAKKVHKNQYGSVLADGQNLLREFFAMVYSVMLGQTDGPRLPNFVAMYGSDKFAEHLERILRERV